MKDLVTTINHAFLLFMAGTTGLEPATSAVTEVLLNITH